MKRVTGVFALCALALGFGVNGRAEGVPGLSASAVPTSARAAAILDLASALKRQAANANSSAEGLSGDARRLFDQAAQTRRPYAVQLQPREVEPTPDGSAETIEGLFNKSDERIAADSTKTKMSDLLKAVLNKAHEKKGVIGYVPMPPSEAGRYVYTAQSHGDGFIDLNNALKLFGTFLIGSPFAFATVVHESAHLYADANNQLHPDHVIDGEVFAFQVEREYLRLIDPTGKRLPRLRKEMRDKMQEDPSLAPILAKAEAYLGSEDVLWKTTDLNEYVRHLGYQEGSPDGHRDGSSSP